MSAPGVISGGRRLTDADVIAAIRRQHLQANIGRIAPTAQYWRDAWVDSGGTIFGPGPYVKLPVTWDGDRITIRVYAPARLRRRLAQRWRLSHG